MRLDVAGSRARVVENAIKEPQSGGAVQTAHVGFGFIEPPYAVGQRHHFVSGKSSGFSPNSASTSSMEFLGRRAGQTTLALRGSGGGLPR